MSSRFLKKLLIDPHLDEIAESVKSNLVTQVNAATGSGKSIGIPQRLAKEGLKVMSSVPTRVSAISLCKFVKNLLRMTKLEVGYAAEGQVFYKNNTDIIYATSGHVRRKLVHIFGRKNVQKEVKFVDVLVLDETHTGSTNNSVIVALWSEALRRGYDVPKLVLLSATPSDFPMEVKPNVIEVEAPTPHPVDIIYAPPKFDEDVHEKAIKIATDCHLNSKHDGDILIFVAGSADVEDIVYAIEQNLKTCTDVVVLPAYSSLNPEDLSKIFDKYVGKRKIVVATNIAESSVTIDGLGVVIDTMMCKSTIMSSSCSSRLSTNYITKDSAKQRLGRTGRTCKGYCYRLIDSIHFECLDEHSKPEINRSPMHSVLLEFYSINLNPLVCIPYMNMFDARNTSNELVKLGMVQIDPTFSTYKVTPCGYFSTVVPLNAKNSCFLWNWVNKGFNLFEGVVIACLIDCCSGSYFYFPKKSGMSREEYVAFCSNYVSEHFETFIGENTLQTYLNMVYDLFEGISSSIDIYKFVTKPLTRYYLKQCYEKSLNLKLVKELFNRISLVYTSARSFLYKKVKTDFNVGEFNPQVASTVSLPILKTVYSTSLVSAGKMRTFEGQLSYVYNNIYKLSKLEMMGGDCISLSSHEILTRKRQVLGIIDICIPLN